MNLKTYQHSQNWVSSPGRWNKFCLEVKVNVEPNYQKKTDLLMWKEITKFFEKNSEVRNCTLGRNKLNIQNQVLKKKNPVDSFVDRKTTTSRCWRREIRRTKWTAEKHIRRLSTTSRMPQVRPILSTRIIRLRQFWVENRRQSASSKSLFRRQPPRPPSNVTTTNLQVEICYKRPPFKIRCRP